MLSYNPPSVFNQPTNSTAFDSLPPPRAPSPATMAAGLPSPPHPLLSIKLTPLSIFQSCLLLFLLAFNLTTAALSSSPIDYASRCNSVVPESRSFGARYYRRGFLELRNGYFSGGEQLFPDAPGAVYSLPKSARISAARAYRSDLDGLYSVQFTLILRGGNVYNQTISRSNRARVIHRRGRVSFNLDGFWSAETGKLCLVGTGYGSSKQGDVLDLSVVVKLNYTNTSTIRTSLISGSVESLKPVGSPSYFNPISLLGFSENSYEYTILPNGCSGVNHADEKSLSLEKDRSFCSILWDISGYGFELEYPGGCNGGKCSPLNGSDGFLPNFMSISNPECTDAEKLHMRLEFYNSSTMSHYYHPLARLTILVSEGVWDSKENRLCLVACRIVQSPGGGDAHVDDCSIGLSLWVPQVLSIKNRSHVVGSMWTNKKAGEDGYFDKIILRSIEKQALRVPGLKYEYTQTELANKTCQKKGSKKAKGKKLYPDGQTSGDMRIDFSVKDADGHAVWGYANPLTYGENFFDQNYGVIIDSFNPTESVGFLAPTVETVEADRSIPDLLNMSYFISFSVPPDYKWRKNPPSGSSSTTQTSIDIFAEGIYETTTGTLCMVGCQKMNNASDCEIAINVQLPPLNPSAKEKLKGTIRSIREKTDALYFEPLELTSNFIYGIQAKEWLWRMDIEMVMVLIALTLTCIFIGLQLFHVKKNPDVLPSMSLLMLLVLTLGYMIPLILNFEAFFFDGRNRQNVLVWNGGWLEANEVLVRIVTMVAFLLQFRLLQLTWSARLAEGTKKDFWASEMKAVRLCVPMYIIGGLIAGFVHWNKSKAYVLGDVRHSVWEDLRSYCGLILDGFLLPQIMLNMFLSSNGKVLSPSFYVGTTAVRSFPHAYDAYRAHHFIPYSNATSYIYANPSADLYSSVWDITIPIGGLVFAVLVFLQQRCGGACVLSRRFGQPPVYEMVPVVNDNTN